MTNSTLFATALYALSQSDTLKHKACKPAVKIFIRQASETPLWNVSTHYRSEAAAAIIQAAHIQSVSQYHHFCRKRGNGLTHEHMVPGEVVYQLIIQHTKPSIQAFEEILRKTGYRATITSLEDKKLRPSSMPDEFHNPKSPMYFDHRARYIEAGIQKNLKKLKKTSWFP